MSNHFWQQWLLTEYPSQASWWKRQLLAVLFIGLTLFSVHPLHQTVDAANIAMLCLLVVVITAIKLGRKPAITVSIVSVIALDFFFVPPHWSFELRHTQYAFTLLVMLLVALIISYLASDLRHQLLEATKREKHLAELYELAQQAQTSKVQMASERLRASILSSLSHDLRTPLTTLHSLAESLTLTQPPLNADAHALAVTMREHTISLHNMVSNLLEMARLQTTGLKLRKEWQLLEEIIGSSIQWLKPSLTGGHTVQVSLPPNLPLVEFDAHLIERVFCNLLENAAKYSPTHSLIQIEAQLNETHVTVYVRNVGDGFPIDKLNQIFNLFERGATESVIPGFGLGLSICRVIIEAHTGEIWAFNPPNGGGAIGFSLPRGTPPSIEPEWALTPSELQS